jgi:hypothetical protein
MAWFFFSGQYEAYPDTDVSLPCHELWSLQKDGNICKCHNPTARI